MWIGLSVDCVRRNSRARARSERRKGKVNRGMPVVGGGTYRISRMSRQCIAFPRAGFDVTSAGRDIIWDKGRQLLAGARDARDTCGIGGKSCAEASFSFSGALETDVALRAMVGSIVGAVQERDELKWLRLSE